MRKGALLIGYARISKAEDQDTAAQVKALRQAGCKRIFGKKASGGRWVFSITVSPFSRNVVPSAPLFSINLVPKQRCFWARRFTFSDRYI